VKNHGSLEYDDFDYEQVLTDLIAAREELLQLGQAMEEQENIEFALSMVYACLSIVVIS
jgi:hypothetical protein